MANAQEPAQQSSLPFSQKWAIHVFVALLLAPALLPLANARSEEVLRAPSGIPYITGGVGVEAVEYLQTMQKDFNLKLLFAYTTGEYLSAIKVMIVDGGGRVVLETTAEGPFLMARLAPGGYQISASFAGQTKRQQVTIRANKLSALDFRWSDR